MAKSKTTDKPVPALTKDELIDELASFLYDAYRHSKEADGDKIEEEKGQNAENEDTSK